MQTKNVQELKLFKRLQGLKGPPCQKELQKIGKTRKKRRKGKRLPLKNQPPRKKQKNGKIYASGIVFMQLL